MFASGSLVRVLPAYSMDTKSRSIQDAYSGQTLIVRGTFGDDVICEWHGDDEVNLHKDRLVPVERHTVKVTFEDGDSLKSTINGSEAEIRAYYAIGRIFNLGTVEDRCVAVTAVEFLR